jgi:hypothetical protein
VGSPGPQGYKGSNVEAARIINGFTAYLPGRTRLFFQRNFFANYPRPIQQGGAAPFPRELPIATIQAPARQSIVLRTVAFRAFQNTGIGVEDFAEVPSGRVVGTLGFKFTAGNRGLTDFVTNLPGRGVPVLYGTVSGQGGPGVTPIAGQGSVHQKTGPITPVRTNENYAGYAMPGDELKATVTVFRPPPYDIRFFSVEMSGWLANEDDLQQIIDQLSR